MNEAIEYKIEEAEVITFEAASGSGYPPCWYQILLKDRELALLVHQNRISEIGPLKAGDKIRFKIAKNGPYFDGGTYLDILEKVEEKEKAKEALIE